MPNLRQVAQQALEALEEHEGNYKLGKSGCERQEKAITAIKKALAQPPLPEQEPVECRFCHSKKGCWTWQCYHCGEIDDVQQPAAQPEQQAEPCIGKDLRCPCQDGDACHYKDCGSTKALPVAQPKQEPTPWRDMVVVTLVREGIDKHRARELADHFAAQPEQEQEPVAWMSSDRAWMWSDYSKAIAAVANIPTLTLIPLYAAPPQRQWVGLTEQDMPSGENPMFDHKYFIAGLVYAAKVLQNKNHG